LQILRTDQHPSKSLCYVIPKWTTRWLPMAQTGRSQRAIH
jgi:hypothetical protein